MVLILTGMLVPVIAFLVFSSVNMAGVMNEKILESGRTALNVYADNVQEKMKNIENRMLDNIALNADFSIFSNPVSNELQLLTAKYNLMEENKALIRQNTEISACIISNKEKNIDEAVWSEEISGYEKKQAILDAVSRYTDADGFKVLNSWTALRVGNECYLCRVMGYRKTYDITLVNLKNYIAPEDSETLFFVQKEDGLTGEKFLSDGGIVIKNDLDHYLTGSMNNYLLIQQPVNNSDVSLIYLRKYEGFTSNLAKKELIIFYISIFSLVLIPISYQLLKRTFFRPVDKMVADMNEIKAGRELPADNSYQEIEFEQVNETFLEMLEQIKQLKIDAYEKKLLIQKVELQYYQIQIRPHFYLNCLKNIYGMLENNQTDKTQKFIIYLSRHLRYMMRNKTEAVTIAEELEYVKNYIRIQELSLKYPPKCLIESDESLLALQIPGISVLSFVENSVKYGSSLPQSLEIRIRISMLTEDQGYILNISVSDNGAGYPEDELVRLNYYTGEEPDGEHIGIFNVMQRFFLFFGREQTGFAFSNMHPGAKSEIFIRLGKSGEEHEHSDG